VRRSLVISLVGIVVLAIVALGATLVQGNSPKLGLDLEGGASVVLAPKAGSVVKSGTLNQAERIISNRVNGLGVAEPNIYRQGNNIVVELPGVKNQDAALKIVGQTAQLEFREVQGVNPMSGTYDPNAGAAPTAPTASTTTTPGATPTTAAGAKPAATTVPAPATTKGALGLPGATGARVATAAATPEAVPAAAPTSAPAATATSAPAAAKAATPTSSPTAASASPTTTAPAAQQQFPPFTPHDSITPQATVVLPELKAGTNQIINGYILGPTLLPGNVVSDASSELTNNGAGPGWEVKVNFNSAGSTAFDKMAKAEYQKQVAIVLDGVVESAPTINAQSFGGTAIISGNSASPYTQKQAGDLALELRYGSLPIVLVQQTVQKVSATLGKSSLRAGLLAGVIGLILVLVYMLLYYRALGLVVVMGLTVSGALMYSLITYLSVKKGLALSLSGATGIIVSVGVTVDSYIVYFERLKDEIRSGKTVRSSVDRGFSRAWKTIWTADLVSLIGAGLLYWLTIGQVRGFAFFLGLSTLLDLFVAYLFTRPMVVLLGRNRTFTEARYFGVARGLAMEPAGSTS
jgi:preprotein translocase subunit SecD